MKTMNIYAGFCQRDGPREGVANLLRGRTLAARPGRVRNAEVGSSSLLPSTNLRS
jgi:hypothetical protein